MGLRKWHWSMAVPALTVFVVCLRPAVADEPVNVKVEGLGAYALYLPPAEKGRKAPVLVWLHPAGGEVNELITRWWPELYEMGWALLLPSSKDPKTWELGEEKTVLAYVDHAAKTYPVDDKKIVLVGFSAGGQLAFYMGMTQAERLAGVIAMSAVPVKSARNLATAMPPAKCKESLAYFMILGEKEDGAVQIAQRAQLELLADGFSAVLHVVKGAGHTFHESEKKNVLNWLAEVAAGKRPAADEIKELAKEAPERLKPYREALEKQEKLRQELTTVAVKLFDDINGSLGKPYALKWREAGEVEQGGKIKIALPEGWKVGEETRNGDSAALQLRPPDSTDVVAYLGRSIQKAGLGEHYQKWFEKMAAENGMIAAKAGRVTVNKREWQLYTFFMVPNAKLTDPLSRRVLALTILPMNKDGTEWRSITIISPDRDCEGSNLAEVIRGVLEKSDFGPAGGAE